MTVLISYFKISSKISFAKAIIKPPKKVRKPPERWEGSWDCRLMPICTTPQPNKIMPIALIAEKTKSERLLIAVKGSVPSAKAKGANAVIKANVKAMTK